MGKSSRLSIFERGDRLYMVGPASPFTPGDNEIEEFAFSKELKTAAPNPNLLWLKGNYVEADRPNANGHVWEAGELGIKSLTPMYCPVTVMHDPRTAVGLIADTKLLTPEKDKVERSRIETALAIWAHRFPDVAEEIAINYEAGTLMQSMECMAPYYSCAECGETFQKLPDGAEEKNWCAHLSESSNASRILGGVTFTGTGLIFGTRGTRGAYDEAHLEVAVQEHFAEVHEGKQTKRSKRRKATRKHMDPIEITREEYAELQKRPKQDELAAEKKRADEAEAAKAEADQKLEAAEAAQKKAEKERDEEKEKVEKADEEKRAAELASDRLGSLGKGFKAALGETTSERFKKDAASLKDEDWEARVAELEELTEVKRDDKGDEGEGDEGGEAASGEPEFSKEETASSRASGAGRSNGNGQAPSEAARGSVVRGLMPKSAAKSE